MTSFIQQQNEIRENEKLRPANRVKPTYFTYKVKILVFLFIFVVVFPALVFYLSLDLGNYKSLDKYTCSVLQDFRVPCGNDGFSEEDCEDASCCYDLKARKCYHSIPSKYYYQKDETSGLYGPSLRQTPFLAKSAKNMQLTIKEKSEDQLSIVLHPGSLQVEKSAFEGKKKYRINRSDGKLTLDVYRKHTDKLIFTTARGPLIASETYWEWTIFLTDQYLFGLDRTLIQFEDANGKQTPNITTVLYPNKNDQHPMPVLWAYQDGEFHGVTIKHQGPLELIILTGQLIILRGLRLDRVELELSLGPTPRDLRKQHVALTKVPPRWALEPHVCRRSNTMSLRTIVQNFQLDEHAASYCVDQDLILVAMTEPKLKHKEELYALLKKYDDQGKKLIVSVSPHIVTSTDLHDAALKLGILYKDKDEIYTGQYLNLEVVYPDYSHPNITLYMEELDNFLRDIINVNIHGFILNDNWPTDDSYEMAKDDFKYYSKNLIRVMSDTLPWYVENSQSEPHLKLHNTYGFAQIQAFESYYNKTDEDTVIMSASGTYRTQESDAMEDVDTTWINLRSTIDNLLFHSIVGNHLTSVPVCGDTGNFSTVDQEALCLRWYWLAATTPLFRISSVEPWREPGSLSNKFGEKIASKAVQLHKSLEGYFYSLLNEGEPVLRPMFYDYYEDNATFSINEQYMLGKDILVAHPLTIDRKRLHVYLPSVGECWYEFWGGQIYCTDKDPWLDIDVTATDFLAFIIQGRLIVLQDDTTLKLVIALHSQTGTSSGSLLIGDNYWSFVATNGTKITISNIDTKNCEDYTLGSVSFYFPDQDPQYSKLSTDLCNGKEEIVVDLNTELESPDSML